MGLVDIVKNLPNYLKNGIDFVGSSFTPSYKSTKGFNKEFWDKLSKMNDNDAYDFVSKYIDDKSILDVTLADSVHGNNHSVYDVIRNLDRSQRGQILSKYGQERAKAVTFTNATNALDYDNFDPKSQKNLDKIYETMTTSEFKEAYKQHQIKLGKKGMFGEKYSSFFKKGEELNEAQLETLSKEFEEKFSERFSNFQERYLPTDTIESVGPPNIRTARGTPVDVQSYNIDRSQRLNYNLGMQRRYLGTRQGKKQLDLVGGKLDKIIERNPNDTDVLNAYKDHLNNSILNTPDIEGKWSAPQTFEQWAKEEAMNDEDIKRLSKTIASGDPDHSGIDIWGMAKRHPVIATSVVMGTAWGISEMAEDDDF